MKTNTFFAVMMACMMAMVSNNAQAQREVMSGRGYHIEMNNQRGGYDSGRRDMDRRDMDHRDMNRGYDNGRRDMGYRDMGRREGYMMHGHRWSHDGWLDGYHGRVRHFADGRWGYYRNGAWMYYDCFYEPAYYYAHPVAVFDGHLLTPRGRRVARAAVGTAIAVGVLAAICR